MKADELLAKAAEIVGGQRAIDYGDKYTNHARIAALWNMWLTELMCSVYNILTIYRYGNYVFDHNTYLAFQALDEEARKFDMENKR